MSIKTLYHLPLCPFSRKVRLCLYWKEIPFQLITERVWEKKEHFLTLNPAGKVPVFEDDDGTIVVESSVIVDYLEEVYPNTLRLLSADRLFKNEIRRLECWFDDKFYQEVGRPIVYQKTLRRYYESTSIDTHSMRQAYQAIQYHLSYICYLLERRKWLAGDEITIADLTAAAHLSCVDYLGDITWDKFPDARDWYARLKSHPYFRPLLSDSIPGVTPASHYSLLDF